MKKDLVIIGGGPAGLAAAIRARECGVEDILVLERDNAPGGILNQCVHNGFGLHTFKQELTGPEYAQRYIEKAQELGIEILLNTMVLDVSADKKITAVSPETGVLELKARAIVLAMGCRERPRGALNIPGSRCAGVFTAGTAQRLVNIDGRMPGREVVILGSGDIGLIMARRMTLEGAKVHAVVELMPWSSGLKRNIVQCLDDYGIPLLLSHTITNIAGRDRLESVTVAAVDEKRRPVPGTEQVIKCDTLLLSVGLLPENELSMKCGVALSPVTGGAVVSESLETSVDGVFACGNVLHVHDLVDNVSKEASAAGEKAAAYLRGELRRTAGIPVKTGEGVRYTVPCTIDPAALTGPAEIRFRVGNVYKDSGISVYFDGERVSHLKKRILTPGEMETAIIKADTFEKYPKCKEITVKVEA